MNPGAMSRSCCKHDLDVLLRLCEKVRDGNGSKDGDSLSAIASLLDAMADHEHYCAFYSSKVQPRVGGLLLT